jgi:hypothetical protein
VDARDADQHRRTRRARRCRASRYQSDDFKPYIYRTTDYGATTVVGHGIPSRRSSAPFARIRAPGTLYAGTENGVYVSFDDGADWQPLQLNLPIVPITDLAVHGSDLVAATQGRSFWILDDLSTLRQLNAQVPTATAHLFSRAKRSDRTGGGGGASASGQNPSAAGRLVLPQGQAGDGVSLEFDRAGKTIRSFRSRENAADPGGAGSPGSNARRAFLGPAPSRFVVLADAGMNRFEWDMRVPDASLPPQGTNLFGASVRGPQVVPGTYQVRLTAGGSTETQPFEIRKDPRTSTTTEDFDKQFALLLQIHERLTVAHDAIAEIIALRGGVRDASARASGTPAATAIAARAQALEAKLAAVQDELVQMNIREGNDVLTYPAKLNNLIAALAPVVAATDTSPTEQSYSVFRDLSLRLERQLSALDEIVERDLSAFNQALDAQHVAAVPARRRQR